MSRKVTIIAPISGPLTGNDGGASGKPFYKTKAPRKTVGGYIPRKETYMADKEHPITQTTAQTIKELEEELKRKQKQLESPFAVVGAGSSSPRPRGRPPGSTNKPKHDVLTPDSEADAIQVAHSQRMAEISRPAPNSSSESVRDWAEKEIHNLLPEAIASLAWDIKYGDQKARSEARGEILRATGIDRKDAANFGKGGQIVINVAGAANGISLPYLNRADAGPEPSSPVVQTLEADNNKKKGKP